MTATANPYKRLDDIDPEVLADLRLQAQTERDRSRNHTGDIPAWQPPKIVGAWKCRGCSVLVDVTEDAFERVAVFNRMLRAKGESPLDTNRIVFCDPCRNAHKAKSGEKRRAEVDRLAEAIRKFKGTKFGTSTFDVMEQRKQMDELRALGHPDVDGLVLAMATRANGGKRKRESEQQEL